MAHCCVPRFAPIFFFMAASVCLLILFTSSQIKGGLKKFSITRPEVQKQMLSMFLLARKKNPINCQPLQQIFYLKTHKTGSSTMANILHRYGDKKNLTFVLPNKPTTFHWPQRFHLHNAYPLYSEPQIMCHHTRYSKGPINWLFPKHKAKYITTIRSPVATFESAFSFYDIIKYFNLGKEVDPRVTFLHAPWTYKGVTNGKRKYPLLYRLWNPILFDLGLDRQQFVNMTAVQSYIEFIDREFDLVMITDHFDESLVLLKRMLCWELEDIVYIKKKVAEKRSHLDEAATQKLLTWNRADALLFEHFNKTLWKKIRDEGAGFFNELEQFRNLNEYYQRRCISNELRKATERKSDSLRKCTQMLWDVKQFYPYLVKRRNATLANSMNF